MRKVIVDTSVSDRVVLLNPRFTPSPLRRLNPQKVAAAGFDQRQMLK